MGAKISRRGAEEEDVNEARFKEQAVRDGMELPVERDVAAGLREGHTGSVDALEGPAEEEADDTLEPKPELHHADGRDHHGQQPHYEEEDYCRVHK